MSIVNETFEHAETGTADEEDKATSEPAMTEQEASILLGKGLRSRSELAGLKYTGLERLVGAPSEGLTAIWRESKSMLAESLKEDSDLKINQLFQVCVQPMVDTPSDETGWTKADGREYRVSRDSTRP